MTKTSDPPSSGDRKKQKRDYAQEAADLIMEMKVDVPHPIAAHNVEPGKMGLPFPVQTNAFGIMVQGESTVYMTDIRIFGNTSNGKAVEFTKKGKDDCLVNDRKEKCARVIEKMVELNPEVFPSLYSTYYDGQSALFSLYEILKEDDDKGKKFTVPSNTIPDDSNLTEIIVEVKPTTKHSFKLCPRTLVSQTANLDFTRNERALTQFLEIVVNEHAIMHPDRHKCFERGKTFMVRPKDEGLTDSDLKRVGDGKVLMVGSQKSVRQIEGPRGRGTNNSAIILDAKKAAFQMEQDLAVKAQEIVGATASLSKLTDIQREKIQTVMRGLFVETMHLFKNKRFQVYGISKHSSVETFFPKDDERISVHDYYAEKYHINLKYPYAPVVLAREKGQINCYPLEVLKVIPFQRVTIPQQTPEQSKQSTRECAVTPATRQRLIMKGAASLDILNPQNQYMSSAKLKIFPTPIKVNARQLPSPAIVYQNGKTEQADLGKWKSSRYQYLIPATCKKWALFCILDARTVDKYKLDDFRSFARKYTEEARKKGMEIVLPCEVAVAKEEDLEQTLGIAASHGCGFALCVVSDYLVNVHKNMKYYERKHQIITQQIQLTNVEKIMNERKYLMLENILNKSNCKLGGLNYVVDVSQMNGVAQKWFTNTRLYIGLHLSHPPPKPHFSEDTAPVPTVVGYAANIKLNPQDIIGDYMLQDSRKADLLPVMAEIIKQCVTRHEKAHEGRRCEELVIYRSNVDEGAYIGMLSREIPLIRAILKKIGFDKVKVVYILVSKAHNVRLMKDKIDAAQKPSEQNIPPGVVCDVNLAHPALKEFYLNSHTTIQGTARTPRYTVLYDEVGMAADEMEGMTWALAHGHQIVSLTTSLPVNLYVAERYAERGANIYSSFQEKEESSSENTSGFDDAMRLLCYNVSKMAENRINA